MPHFIRQQAAAECRLSVGRSQGKTEVTDLCTMASVYHQKALDWDTVAGGGCHQTLQVRFPPSPSCELTPDDCQIAVGEICGEPVLGESQGARMAWQQGSDLMMHR
jgi:hypothetical protein